MRQGRMDAAKARFQKVKAILKETGMVSAEKYFQSIEKRKQMEPIRPPASIFLSFRVCPCSLSKANTALALKGTIGFRQVFPMI